MILAPAFSQSCLAAADSSQTPTSSKSLEARITPSLPGAWEYVAPRKPIRILRFVPAGSPAMRNPDGLAPTAAAQQTAETKNFRRLIGCSFMRVGSRQRKRAGRNGDELDAERIRQAIARLGHRSKRQSK